MSSAYAPSCPACRTQDATTFHRSCGGCKARKAHLEALRRAAATPPTPDQMAGMDSTMQPLEKGRP
jgi:hypothetical protein